MIMKRKNIILSAFLSLAILMTTACNSGNTETATVTSSDTSANVETTEATTTAAETTTTEETTTALETTASTTEAETSELTTTTTEITTTAEQTTTIETTVSETTAQETEETTVTTTIAETEAVTTETAIEKKYIALTFDDGPNTTTTNEVLDVLEQYGIKGSFFLIGNNINDESAKSVKRAYDMGCDIGNHSKAHLYMNELTPEEIKAEIDYVSEYIVEITGEEPKFFRPPYIAVNNTMYDNIDLTFIAGFGCNDWDDAVPPDRRAKVILRQAQDGGIILLHDAQGNSKTVEALHMIIPELQAQGYEFVTLTELFEIKGVAIDPDDSNLYTFVG